MKCKNCKKEMDEGEASTEYCDGYCPDCYDIKEEAKHMEWEQSLDYFEKMRGR